MEKKCDIVLTPPLADKFFEEFGVKIPKELFHFENQLWGSIPLWRKKYPHLSKRRILSSSLRDSLIDVEFSIPYGTKGKEVRIFAESYISALEQELYSGKLNPLRTNKNNFLMVDGERFASAVQWSKVLESEYGICLSARTLKRRLIDCEQSIQGVASDKNQNITLYPEVSVFQVVTTLEKQGLNSADGNNIFYNAEKKAHTSLTYYAKYHNIPQKKVQDACAHNLLPFILGKDSSGNICKFYEVEKLNHVCKNLHGYEELKSLITNRRCAIVKFLRTGTDIPEVATVFTKLQGVAAKLHPKEEILQKISDCLCSVDLSDSEGEL